jgi:protein-tyrosine phosphatase
MNILMVCLGNICRSPLAEGIMQHKALQAGKPWMVDSAGTGNWHIGEPPHRLSQKIALHYGINIAGQRARQFTPEDCIRFDHIYFMDIHNLHDARNMAGSLWVHQKASLLLDVLYPGSQREVPDPYYGTEQDYHHVFQLISEACDAILAKAVK